MKDYKIKSIHLDTARTFIPIDELYDRVDEFSALDYTHMQLHLSDDQGWRFESVKYPKLTGVGSIRDRLLLSNNKSISPDPVPYQGFYTQQELRDLVKYANSKNLHIIPAIDIPGHCSAAIYAYPELNSGFVFDKVPSLRGAACFNSRGSTICYTQKFTKTWVKEIYQELMDVFRTSEYVHMGFDEITKGECQTCGNCTRSTLTELLKIGYDEIISKGRKPIIWWAKEKDSFDFSKFPKLTLQYWGAGALNELNTPVDNDIIYSQPSLLYFDYPESTGTRVTVHDDMGQALVHPHKLHEKIKHFPSNVVGVGTCFWSENLSSREIRDDYMYPRLIDLANILKGHDIGKWEHPLGEWGKTAYTSDLVKLIRRSTLSGKDKTIIRDVINSKSMGEILSFLDINYPSINFRSIPLTRISPATHAYVKKAKLKDIEIINNLYGIN